MYMNVHEIQPYNPCIVNPAGFELQCWRHSRWN